MSFLISFGVMQIPPRLGSVFSFYYLIQVWSINLEGCENSMRSVCLYIPF